LRQRFVALVRPLLGWLRNSNLVRLSEWKPRPRAVCVAQYFDGNHARCLVEVEGMSLPVSFPAAALRHHGLTEHSRFEWRMRKDGVIRARDIRPLPDPTLSANEWRELRRRYEEEMSQPLPVGRPH